MLDIDGLMARYGIKRTAAYELVKQPVFPGPVAPRRWRLDHVMAYEEFVGRRRTTPVAVATAPDPSPSETSEKLAPAAVAAVAVDEIDVLASRRPRRKVT